MSEIADFPCSVIVRKRKNELRPSRATQPLGRNLLPSIYSETLDVH